MESELQKELAALLNRHSQESRSGTPDFILAGFLLQCLEAFNNTMWARANWYGKDVAGPGKDGR